MKGINLNPQTVEDLIGKVTVDAEVSGDGVTCYGIYRVIVTLLEKNGISEKGVVTPNMLYGYAKKGRINGKPGVKRFTSDEAATYAAKFVKTVLIRKGRLNPTVPEKSPQTPKK